MLPKTSMILPQERHQVAPGKGDFESKRENEPSNQGCGSRAKEDFLPSPFPFKKKTEKHGHQDKGGEKKAHEVKQQTVEENSGNQDGLTPPLNSLQYLPRLDQTPHKDEQAEGEQKRG